MPRGNNWPVQAKYEVKNIWKIFCFCQILFFLILSRVQWTRVEIYWDPSLQKLDNRNFFFSTFGQISQTSSFLPNYFKLRLIGQKFSFQAASSLLSKNLSWRKQNIGENSFENNSGRRSCFILLSLKLHQMADVTMLKNLDAEFLWSEPSLSF